MILQVRLEGEVTGLLMGLAGMHHNFTLYNNY
jgi:hypothetical protein